MQPATTFDKGGGVNRLTLKGERGVADTISHSEEM